MASRRNHNNPNTAVDPVEALVRRVSGITRFPGETIGNILINIDSIDTYNLPVLADTLILVLLQLGSFKTLSDALESPGLSRTLEEYFANLKYEVAQRTTLLSYLGPVFAARSMVKVSKPSQYDDFIEYSDGEEEEEEGY